MTSRPIRASSPVEDAGWMQSVTIDRLLVARHHARRPDHLLDQLVEVHGQLAHRVGARIGAGQREEIVDDARHPNRLVLDDCEGVAVVRLGAGGLLQGDGGGRPRDGHRRSRRGSTPDLGATFSLILFM